MWYTYILKSKKYNQLYIGSTNNLNRRLKEHNNGDELSTKRYRPWEILYYEAYQTEDLARLREKRLKYNGNAMRELKKRIGILSKSGAGFTLLEILLVILIIVFLAVLIFPLSLNFYKSQQLQNQTQQILQTLRRAQLKAMSVEGDSSFGVYITNASYTLFKGNSFATRDTQYDEVFELPQIITVSGLSEIIFLKSEGKPNLTGNIVLSNDGNSQTININKAGRINLQ